MSDGEEDGYDEATKSERKRQRERQRRSDLATAFDELSSLVSSVLPEDTEHSQGKRKRKRTGSDVAAGDNTESWGMTRLDLIGRTIEAMRRLQRENAELRRELQERDGGKDKEVLVMLPTLSQSEADSSSRTAREPHYAPPYYGSTHPATQGMYPPQEYSYSPQQYYSGGHQSYSYPPIWGSSQHQPQTPPGGHFQHPPHPAPSHSHYAYPPPPHDSPPPGDQQPPPHQHYHSRRSHKDTQPRPDLDYDRTDD